ncbi:homoserine kinase [Gordonia araii NBRC 100433]|uniref:Homoserine kinase n=1 Tax=Gordonia araii NBRC 100433 TaxID=1073574 RepID=G7H6P5_9ACTN|nr:homoserine kinase [Gordonia araii]NNG98608.1 homoserine kinase [Gordonia araii NBRC 100433]GAB11520.1 homoserine kinase [Gordonia araii NBRC 100433]
MTTILPAGLRVAVRVPASSANLGPGFDCLGLALGIYDDVTVTTVDEPGVRLTVTGEGADSVPLDETHLVAQAITRGLAHAGAAAAGLQIDCVNAIPHSRGVGSSASAAVSGLVAASGLLGAAAEIIGTQALSDDELVQLSAEFEGHPDNAAASVLGGAVVTWTDGEGEGARYSARRLQVDPRIRATAFIAHAESSTSQTRRLLPDEVPRCDAVFNLSRTAVAVLALTREPDLLLAATEDRLHQGYRADSMAPSAELVAQLRAAGYAATISGAGPTVLVLHTADIPASAVDAPSFTMVETAISDGPTVVDAR